MAIRGLGGVFFKSSDPTSLADWYEEHLGIARDDGGYTTMGWRELDRPERIGQTVWAPFPSDSDYFGEPTQQWMVNYRVDDLDAELERLESEGVELVGEPQSFDYGKFAWGLDPEGNRFELWEPADATGFSLSVPAGANEYVGSIAPICDPGKAIATTGAEMSDDRIVVETTVALDVDEVWRLWTTSEGLSTWLVEHNHVELRLGGPYEWYFDPEAPQGQKGGEGNKVLSFLPGRFLSFTWNSPPSLPYTRALQTHVVVEFTRDDGDTHVRLTHLGFPSSDSDDHDEWPQTVDYFSAAWPRVLAALERHASGA